jgi:predicted deacylase
VSYGSRRTSTLLANCAGLAGAEPRTQAGRRLMAAHMRSTLLALVLGLILSLPAGSVTAYEPETADPRPVRIEPPAPPEASAEALPAGDGLFAEQRHLRPASSETESLVIGYSVEGRPIKVVRFGEGSRSRLIVAGIHGGSEANTTALAHELIAHLQAHPESVSDALTLYILPELNPDGAARASGPQGRTNARGVDLNRNWPAAWHPAWPRSGCWNLGPTTGGERPASEPETMSLIQFISASGIEALINYHSAALGIFAGGQPPEARSLRLAEELAAVSTYPFPPIDTGCVFTGQLIDWAANNGIAAVDIELHNHRDTDFEENLAILSAFLAWQP